MENDLKDMLLQYLQDMVIIKLKNYWYSLGYITLMNRRMNNG